MNKRFGAWMALAMAGLPATGVWAASSQDRQIEALTERVQALEQRVAALEGTAKEAAPQAATAATDRRARVQQRFELDRTLYAPEQLQDVERLYQVANRQWDSPESQASLKQLIEKYPKANRTGCALLYLGQMASGPEKERYLKQAIADFSDCCYGNGVQVGAYARFHLAHYYRQAGKAAEAAALFEEIRTAYPDAINHKGRPLEDLMPR